MDKLHRVQQFCTSGRFRDLLPMSSVTPHPMLTWRRARRARTSSHQIGTFRVPNMRGTVARGR
eukprot:7193007-Pyramimonas_sp.AAC.1